MKKFPDHGSLWKNPEKLLGSCWLMTRIKISQSRKLPNVFSKEQLLEIFKVIEEPDVMLAVIIGAFCGLRIGEICRLRKQDLDLSRMQLKVVNGKLPGKTLAGHGKDRVVPIPSKIIPLLQMWCDLREGEYLLGSISLAGRPITTQHLFKKYKLMLKKANLYFIDKQNKAGNKIARYNFHTLRHTYATMLWEKTGDIYAVKQALGHSDLDITLVYTHISDKALQQKVNSAFNVGLLSKPIQREQIRIEEKSNPLEIIKLRLAKGEIEVEKFNEITRALAK